MTEPTARQLKYVDHIKINGKDVYTFRWPTQGIARNNEAMKQSIGHHLVIDGVTRKVLTFETYALLSPLRQGDPVGVMVE